MKAQGIVYGLNTALYSELSVLCTGVYSKWRVIFIVCVWNVLMLTR